MPAADPQFSPDGRLLLAPSDNRQPEVLIFAAATGEHVKTLTGAQAEIACISIGKDGVARACDISSTITAWDLASGRLLYQHRLECLPASVSSS
jgi:WD40 repeat protein